jgi:RHS repeat-associated protein
VALDDYQNLGCDPSGNFVAIIDGSGCGAVDGQALAHLATNTAIPGLYGATTHVSVAFSGGSTPSVAVWLNGTQALNTTVSGMPSSAYLGFTASNGYYWQRQLVSNLVIEGAGSTLPPGQTIGTEGGRGVHALSPTHTFVEPVNSLTGAFTTSATDLSTPGLGVPFDFARSYTSSDTTVGPLGPGWADSLSAALLVQANGDVLVHGEDGQQIYYTKQSDGSFVGAPGALSTLSAVTDGYLLVSHDQVTYLFDSSGVLQSELDRNGQGLTFSYTGGQLTSVTDAADRTATLAYNGGLLSSVTSADGRTVSYGYTGGLLTSVTLPDPDGGGPLAAPLISYTYDAAGRLATEVDPNGHTVFSNVYDPSSGRVTQQTDANGKTTTFAWDAGTSTATVTDPDGHVWHDVYQNNLISEEIDPAGDTTQFSYDAGFDTGSVTAPDGSSTTALGYDGNHNLEVATAPASLESVQKTLTYDAQNNVTSVTDARGKLTQYGYDAAGNNTSITLDGQQVFAATYDGQGQMLTSTDGNGNTTTYSYDAAGNLASVTDPRGNETTYTYTDAGLLASEVDPRGNCAGCNPAEHTTSYSYDADGRLLSVTDQLGHTTSYSYDAAGNKTSETDANGHTTSYSYDAANHLTTITGPDPDGSGPLAPPVTTYGYDDAGNQTSVTDPRGNTTNHGYNENNQLVSVTDPLGNETTYSYDANGNLASSVDPRGNCSGCNPADYTTTYTYDAAGRVLTTTDPLGNITTNSYDPVGNLAGITDANGHTTSYTYDPAGRILTVTAPDGGTTSYSYDPNGNQLSRTDANSHTTSYSYDADNELLTTTDPLAHVTSDTYDANGNLAIVAKPSGGSVTYSYDSANRLAGTSYSDGTHSVAYTYDAAGNRTSMSDAAGTISYSYDNLNQLTSSGRGNDTFTYSYDPAGDITSRTYPDGTTTTYSYNADNQATNVSASNGLAGLVYDPAGHLTAIQFGGEFSLFGEGYAYDRAGRLVDAKATYPTIICTGGGGHWCYQGSAVRSEFATTLDAVGNPLQIVRTGDINSTTTYTYDANDRLVSVCSQPGTCPSQNDPFIRWTYDRVGNRLTETRPNSTTTYTYNQDDQLTQAGNTNYSYDLNGNQIAAGATTLTYNLANELTTLAKGNTTTTYSYDGEGNRLQASTGSSASKKTNYLWDTNNPLPQVALERDGNNNTLRSYLYGPQRLAMFSGGNTYYYVTDTLGSVAELTDSTGKNPQWAYTYDPFGVTTTADKLAGQAPANPMQFTAEYLDPTGLYNLRARQYDPTTGRFLSADSVTRSDSGEATSTYAYAGARPTVLDDPSGRTSEPATDGIQAVLLVTSVSPPVCGFFGCTVLPGLGTSSSTVCVEGGTICEPRGGLSGGSVTKATWALAIAAAASLAVESCRRTHCLERKDEVWHHIVAKNARAAAQGREVLGAVEPPISVEDRVNKVQLPAWFHARLHTNFYYRSVNESVAEAADYDLERHAFQGVSPLEAAPRVRIRLGEIGAVLKAYAVYPFGGLPV